MIVDLRGRHACARSKWVLAAIHLWALIGLLVGVALFFRVLPPALAIVAGLVLASPILYLPRYMIADVIARPEGLQVDGELVEWSRTSELELSYASASLIVFAPESRYEVTLYGKDEDFRNICALRAAARSRSMGAYR